MDRQALGKSGEQVACDALRRRGYEILERRYRTRYGEIDIVCRYRDLLVFVEVKARVGRQFGTALEAVTALKQRRVAAIAGDYLTRRHIAPCHCRFDVVGITYDEQGRVIETTIVPGAFDARG